MNRVPGQRFSGRRFPGQRPVHALFFVGLVILAVTGLIGWIRPERISGWNLLVHVMSAPLFCLGLAALALLGADFHRTDRPPKAGSVKGVGRGRSAVYWAVLVFGAATLGSILVAMLPFVGAERQEGLYGIHRWSAAVLIVCTATYSSLLRRSKKGGAARE